MAGAAMCDLLTEALRAVISEDAAIGLFGHSARFHVEFSAAEIELAFDDIEVVHHISRFVSAGEEAIGRKAFDEASFSVLLMLP